MYELLHLLKLLTYLTCTLAAILARYVPMAQSIQCFKCTIVAPPAFPNEPKRLCSSFDYSDHYIVDCPYSTFCMRKTYVVDLNENLINGTIRDCALQKNVIQVYEDEKWQRKVLIEEPYKEGCLEINDKGQRLSNITYSYCKGDLCNGRL
ncbi:hypothetical protein ILUMI_23457 [Ignelater luminosus]|uniref:Protein quiver n=1 Tax=Ignelater luminosus TaxID=2038154 RepID=A0A8K0CAW7_IGNLU|nr:hypothetical protein ILUMI_23457 [Ignelater luminosus]